MAALCLLYISGIFCGDRLALDWHYRPWWIIVAALTVACGWLLLRRRSYRMVGFGMLVWGFLSGSARFAEVSTPLIEETIPMDGVVVGGVEDARGMAQLDIRMCPGTAMHTLGHLWLTFPASGNVPHLLGRAVHLVARLAPPHGLANPGVQDSHDFHLRHGLFAFARLTGSESLVVWSDPSPLSPRCRLSWFERSILRLQGAALALQQRLADALLTQLPQPEAQVIGTVTLGIRRALPAKLQEAFVRLGISHVLSVSGLHFAVLLWLVVRGGPRLLLALPMLGRRWPVGWIAVGPALALVWAYTLVVGSEVATVRSALFVTLWLCARLLFRSGESKRSLWLTAMVVLGVEPAELFEPAFQLSFVATWALLYLAKEKRAATTEPASVAKILMRKLFYLVRCTVAALLATLPITAWHFSQISWVGIVANLIFVPIFELVVLPLVLLAGIAHPCFVLGGKAALVMAGFVTYQLCQVIVWASVWVPDGFVPRPSVWFVVGWFVALCLWVVLPRRHGRWALVLGVAVLAGWGFDVAAARYSHSVKITFLDIGQGDSTIVELPGNFVMVIDGGGSFDPTYDPGERVLSRVLRANGINHIDRLVLTHPHPDHANGLPFVAEHFPVGEIWYSGERTDLPSALRLFEIANRRAIPIEFPHREELERVVIEPLAPRTENGAWGPRLAWQENDNSLVLLLSFGDKKVLFTGDIESAAEAALLSERIDNIDVIKVAHHGSKTSSTAPFVQRARPRLAIASLGFHNRWGFPHRQVVDRFSQLGSRFLRTDENGAITVEISNTGRLCWHSEREKKPMCQD